MGACLLLLGRLWQISREVIYDGQKNTYTIIQNGLVVALLLKIRGGIQMGINIGSKCQSM